MRCYNWDIILYGAVTWELRQLDQIYLESFEKGCWRKIDIVRKAEEVLQTVKEERNILHTIKRSKAKWLSHILHSNCLLKHVIKGKI